MKKRDFLSNKFDYILLASVLIIGIIIRYWGLGEKSLWIDEIYSNLFASQKSVFTGLLCILSDLSPPVYYFVLTFWTKLFGNSEFMLRFPSFLAGILLIPFVYLSAKKIFDKKTAVLATIFTSFSPSLLYYSQEARPYSLFVLFCCITIFLWIDLVHKIKDGEPDAKTFISYTAASLAAILTHYWGAVLIGFQLLYLIVFSVRKKRELYSLITATLNIIFISGIFLFFQYVFLNKINAVFDLTIEKVSSGNPLLPVFNLIFYNSKYFCFIVIIFLLFNIIKYKTLFKKEIWENKLASPLIYLTYIIIFPIIFYLVLDKFSAYLHPRHLLFIVIPAYILISRIISSIDAKKSLIINILVFSFCLVFLGVFLFIPKKINGRSFTYYKMPKQEWKEAAKYLIEQPVSNDSLIIIDRDKAFYYDYYFYRLNNKNKKLNIIFNKNLFNKNTIGREFSNYKKKYNKIYIFSTSMFGVKNIENSLKEAKCIHLRKKEFVNVNFYECY